MSQPSLLAFWYQVELQGVQNTVQTVSCLFWSHIMLHESSDLNGGHTIREGHIIIATGRLGGHTIRGVTLIERVTLSERIR